MFLHIVGSAFLLALSAMNYELDKADARMKAEPVPSVQEALDARERFAVPVVVGPGGGGWTDLRDSAPPSTTLKVCRGDLPSQSVLGSADAGCLTYEVGSTDRAHPDLLAHNDDDTFRHVYRISGDPACVGTGKPLGSGRDCTIDSAPEGQCAYVAEGFAIYAVTGGSCSENGIALCSGPFCI